MGKLHYNSSSGTDFEDRLLAHLQLVIGTKLGRGESFYLSWKNTVDIGSGRRSVWLHPAIPLDFTFAGNRSPSINLAWVRQLMQDSYTVNGLRISPEPDPGGTDPHAPDASSAPRGTTARTPSIGPVTP
ncbi:ATP-dependent DNA ligase [Rathayibacter sp. VKM Ac-2801]|uniref:DUF7882 family protein n=1 Tax=Rathayibacter sp. VKM Ac-2801 TaxID=2609255 RepID=UPI00131F9362|nr:ATP-dependent DNA ligase [Rathayibacter sp. VKM Ac-2801]QHC69333.1 ATP-dependent DNA ligase [Rathayibacter sp. VKM Ac-2801]